MTEYEHALPGYGAFKLADVKDAKRRRPAASLEAYAAARGLEHLPGDGRLEFNVLKGDLPGGRHGVLFHHVLAVPYDGDAGGSGLKVSVYKPKLGFRDALSFIPVLGHVFDATIPPRDKRPQAVGVPTTEAAALVPEAAAIPPFECTSAAARLRMLSGRRPEAGFADRLRATAFGDVVREHANRPYFRLAFADGRLSIRVDGYVAADGDLDALARAVSAAASGLAQACAAVQAPAA